MSEEQREDREAPPPFSAATRREHWEALPRESLDLLVVGAGITGAGIALEAACRGLSVAVVDAGDVGGGTSSASSRLIHGGLRYLETFDFALVFEALGERRRLLQLAPHLVWPLEFLFPVYAGDPTGLLKLRAGMWLYDGLSLFQTIERHRILAADAVRAREPAMRDTGLQGGAVYHDAQVDDARLTLAVARAAHEAGARVLPYVRVAALLRDGRGRLTGAALRDSLTGAEAEVSARLVLSAAGPWTDEVRRLADPAAAPRLRPTKGVHIVLPRARVGNRGAVIFRSAVDGRVMFVLPWGDFTYVGTTDTDLDTAPGDAHASAADVDYLLRSTNALYPAAALSPDDVVSTWTGVRPLLAPAGGRGSESQTSREHDIWRERNGLLCVAGGKLTTYRVMAREAAQEAAAILAREHSVASGDCYTEHLPLPGAPDEPWERFRERVLARAADLHLPAAAAEHLARSYGADAESILDAVRADRTLGEPMVQGLPYLWAELPHAVRAELTLTLEDLMRRRLHLLYETPDGGLDIAEEVARRMAAEPALGWSAAEIDAQLQRFRAAVAATRPG